MKHDDYCKLIAVLVVGYMEGKVDLPDGANSIISMLCVNKNKEKILKRLDSLRETFKDGENAEQSLEESVNICSLIYHSQSVTRLLDFFESIEDFSEFSIPFRSNPNMN